MRRLPLLLLLLAACSAPPVLEESERGVRAGDTLHLVATKTGTGLRSVAGDAPGESDLFLDDKPLAPAPGADDLPLLLQTEGGAEAVVFVSSRSGVASIWRVNVDGSGLVQLTNVGLKPGHLDDTFLPPPARSWQQAGDDVVYDDGSGTIRRIKVTTSGGLR